MLRRSLIVRLVGMSLLLLLIVQAAGFAVVRATIDRNARSQIARELDTDENVWRRLLDQNAEKLRQGSALLAADYGFRSAVNSDDEETIQSVLENHGSRIGAEVTALLDTRLNLRSLSASGGARDFQAAVRQVAPLLASQPQGSRMAVIGGVPYQFVMVPMRAPVVIGWVLMGFPVSQPLADEMRQLLSVHVALLVKGEDGVLSVPVSTLPAAPLALLRRQGIPTGELDTDQGVLLARASPLDTVGGEVQALLLRSVDEVVAPYRQLQVLLAIITVAGVLLFALGNGVMAQRVTTPLRSLLAATRRLSRGEYDVPMEHTDRADEIGNLARSFDKMRVDIGAQQSEIRRLAFWDRLTGLPNREPFLCSRGGRHLRQCGRATSAGCADPGPRPVQACERCARLCLWRPAAAGGGGPAARAGGRTAGHGGPHGRQRVCRVAARGRCRCSPRGGAPHPPLVRRAAGL